MSTQILFVLWNQFALSHISLWFISFLLLSLLDNQHIVFFYYILIGVMPQKKYISQRGKQASCLTSVLVPEPVMVNPLGPTGREDESLFYKELSEVQQMPADIICLAFLGLSINPSWNNSGYFRYFANYMMLSFRSSLFLVPVYS